MSNEPVDKKQQKQMRAEYMQRINRVVDYIENNIDQELTLEKLANVAAFSQFHFHRIFGMLTGETLNNFIQRIRSEKAAIQLVCNPEKSVTAIALDCGFSGSAPFARTFKKYFGMSAGQWRAKKKEAQYNTQIDTKNQSDSKISQELSKIRQDIEIISPYIDSITNNQIWRIKMKNKPEVNVEVKTLPDMTVAYVRYVGPYKGDAKLFEGLFTKLMTWAGPRGLINFPETKIISVYHDDPGITDEEKLRTSACMTVPEETEVNGEIGKMVIQGGKYALAHFELATDEYEEAWKAVMAGWLPESGYQPDDRPCFEMYLNDPKEHPEGKCIVDICIPVKPL